MALFKESVLNKHLNHLDEYNTVQAYSKFQENNNLKRKLKNQNITLSLIQHDEWEDCFTKYKTKINHLQSQTDYKIDQMVYKLYGLTDEEIVIVEGG